MKYLLGSFGNWDEVTREEAVKMFGQKKITQLIKKSKKNEDGAEYEDKKSSNVIIVYNS